MSTIGESERSLRLKALGEGEFDLLVVGGGIVGAGIARDAAMRGLKVALVDQHDFAFGTSSRSSRLLHGGIRYLAQGRIGLVREASREKKVLFRIARHLAEPLPFVFPAYEGSRWPLWQLRVGVKIYDWLGGADASQSSSTFTREKTLQQVHGLKAEGLAGSVCYYDALTNDARLVLDTLRSAELNGATLANYVRFERAQFQSGIWDCALLDAAGERKIQVRARSIANATGPWGDQLPQSRVRLRLTKGVHLVFDRHRLPVRQAVVVTEGKRVLFVIPWGDRVITGTTDTDYAGALDQVYANRTDIDYVVGILNEFFPSAALSRGDVISTWAGLRPLIGGGKGIPSDISRHHQITNPQPFWWDVAGGKLTTYRLIAEQVVDQIKAQLKLGGTPCRTADVPLLPLQNSKNTSCIVPPAFSQELVEHFCANEWALHLDDIMIRRTSWQHYCKDAKARAEDVLLWMGNVLGWTDNQRNLELQRYRELGSDT